MEPAPVLSSLQTFAGLGLDAIFDDVRDGLVVIRFPEGSVVLANRSASEMCAVPRDLALPVSVDQVFSDAAVEETARKCAEYAEHPVGFWAGHPQEVLQTHIKGRDGSTRNVELRFCRVADQILDGPLVLVVIRGDSEARLGTAIRIGAGAQDRVEELETDVEGLETDVKGLKTDARALALLFSEATHELNTPLTIVTLQTQMLRGQLGPVLPAQEQALAVIKSNIQRLVLVVQDLGDLARADAGRLVLHRVPVDLVKLVGEEVGGFQPLAKEAGLSLSFAGSPATVVGEALRLRQILANLLANAIKFTPSGGQIFVDVSSTHGWAAVSIRDTGPGMREEDRAKLFQPFVRIQSHTGIKKPGTGLGLYLSKRIAEAHGGQLACSSPGIGQGMTFQFRMPALCSTAAASAQQRPEPSFA